jgi:hypothetical protein
VRGRTFAGAWPYDHGIVTEEAPMLVRLAIVFAVAVATLAPAAFA